MTDDDHIKIIKQAIEEVNRKYEQEAIYEAYDKAYQEAKERGRKEAAEEITKNLKGKSSPEKIAKITGLSLNRVCELLDS